MTRWHPVLLWIGYAAGAILLALLVILPVFYLINAIYRDGAGLTPLLVAVIIGWALLAWLLARRRVRL